MRQKYKPSGNFSLTNNNLKTKITSIGISKNTNFKKVQTQEELLDPKEKYTNLFRNIVKKYVLFFEFSVMKSANRSMKRNKWKKIYRKLKILTIKKFMWKILYSDLILLHKRQHFQKMQKKLVLTNKFLFLYRNQRKKYLQEAFNSFLIRKFFEKWRFIINQKKMVSKMIYKYICDSSNCYYQNLAVISAKKIQKWYRNIKFYKKLENLYNIEGEVTTQKNQQKEEYKFASFDFLLDQKVEMTIKPLFTHNFYSFLTEKEIIEKEIEKFSQDNVKEMSNSLSLDFLLDNNSKVYMKKCQNLLQYKFEEEQSNKTTSRSKRNEIINFNLKPMKMKINCSFNRVCFISDIFQSLINFVIQPEVKSPNDLLIIERTEKLKQIETKKPKYVFYQDRYRSQYKGEIKHYFDQSTIVKHSNVRKQIFYTPKKINPNKITKYNEDKKDKGISVKTCTFGEFLVSDLKIDIPLRFSDLLTAENLNIHEFQITYDPVMKQGIDNEIDFVFRKTIFKPHLSFRQIIRDNIEKCTYFLNFFRYVPYHLSKHQKRKFTEIIEPLLHSIFFDRTKTVISANYMLCQAPSTPKRKHRSRYSHKNHNNYLNKRRYNRQIENSEFSEETIETSTLLTSSLSQIDHYSDHEYDTEVSLLDEFDANSFSSMKKMPKIVFCGESDISFGDNELLIEGYQSLTFSKKSKY